jgi:hypothetical protein
MAGLLWLVFLVLIILWLVGFSVNWGGFIWLLLIFALIALLINVITGVSTRRWW